MSFILDALRRAESERERGHVPGLHAQPAPAGLGEEPGVLLRRPTLRWAGAAAGAGVLLALAGWWLLRPSGAPAPDRTVAAAAPVEPAETAAPLAPPAHAPAPVAPPLLVAPPLAQGPAAAAPSPPGRSGRAPRTVQPPRGAALEPPAAPVPALVPPLQPPPAQAGAADGAPIVPMAELTPAQRAGLPPMAFGGAIHSEQPSSRFLLVNGQVVREGEDAAPGVVLERIGRKSALLRWRELRIEVPL